MSVNMCEVGCGAMAVCVCDRYVLDCGDHCRSGGRGRLLCITLALRDTLSIEVASVACEELSSV